MRLLTKLIDVATIGSESPMRRLIAYYAVLIAVTCLLLYFFPIFDVMFSGERLEELTNAPRLLEDGLASSEFDAPRADVQLPPRLEFAIVAASAMIGTVFLMLPVTWVYMSARNTTGYSQAIVQTLLILPIVVAGIVLIVRNSLALAFSLAGIVAGVRFRNALKDARDAVFVFLAIGVGLAAGVQAMTVAGLLSLVFNVVVLLVWQSNFGRSVLVPRPAAKWNEPLETLAENNGGAKVPDRELVLALTPDRASALADRFARVRELVGGDGPNGKKPRYNAVLWVTTTTVTDAQQAVERALSQTTKRWKLDEVITNEGKPSELYYLVKIRKTTSTDDVITAVRAIGGEHIATADLELGRELVEEREE